MTIPTTGVMASMALPMTPTAAIDDGSLRSYARWLANQGVAGLVVNADTGEGAHLSTAERCHVVEVVRDEVDERVPIVSGLIAPATDHAVALAGELRAAGADGLLVFAPATFAGQPLPAELPYEYHAAIGEVGLDLIGFTLTTDLGVELSSEALRRLCEVPQLVAVKDATFDAAAFVRNRDTLRAANGDVALLTGCDNFIYESMVLGADGALLGYAGLAGELTVRLHRLVTEGRIAEAERLNRLVQPLAEIMFARPMRNSRARIKHALVELGVIDHDTVRPPLPRLEDADREAMTVAMKVAELR